MTVTLRVYKEIRRPGPASSPFPKAHPLHEEAHGEHFVCGVTLDGNDHRRMSEFSAAEVPTLASKVTYDIEKGANRMDMAPSEVRFEFNFESRTGTRMIYHASEPVHLEVERFPLGVWERATVLASFQGLIQRLSPTPKAELARISTAAAVVI